MEFRPILSALMRSKVALILIGLQIALTLAIVCNSLFIIATRFEQMGRPSGFDEANTFTIGSIGFGAGFDISAQYKQDLAELRGLAGVVDVTPINTMPLSQGGWSMGVSLKPDQPKPTSGTAIYFTDEHGLDAAGLKLVAGRNFKPEEISERDRNTKGWPAAAIITKALADKVWPGQDAVGKQFYVETDSPPTTVIGVVDRLQAAWPHADIVEFSTIVPQLLTHGAGSRYLIRTQPGRRDEVMKAAEAKLAEVNPSRIIRGVKSMEQIRSEGYAGDRAMTIILLTVIGCLLTITALGIVGMASFWVTQRTKQIGTRRALGATKGDILRYFLTENFVITTLGLIAGGVLAYGFNFWLMSHYQAQRMPWFYVPIGFLTLWTLGQLAVLGPATRASKVAPAIATRSV